MAAPISRNIGFCNRMFKYAYRKVSSHRFCSTRDPAQTFLDPEVQSILRKVSGFNLAQIFEKKNIANTEPPKYRFLTDAQFEELLSESEIKAKEKLQMPPVMKTREDPELDITKDEELEHFAEDKSFVFTDISYGLHDRERVIVVRQPDGVLRHACHEERDRILQAYYPKPGRTHHHPEMFSSGQLESLLNRGDHQYVMERLIVQYEPDHPDFIRVAHRCYEHIRENDIYENLRNTRFFGPMVFYFAFYNKADDIIAYTLLNNRLDDAGSVVRLHNICHPESVCAQQCQSDNPLQLVTTYMNTAGARSGKLQHAFGTFTGADLSVQSQPV